MSVVLAHDQRKRLDTAAGDTLFCLTGRVLTVWGRKMVELVESNTEMFRVVLCKCYAKVGGNPGKNAPAVFHFIHIKLRQMYST